MSVKVIEMCPMSAVRFYRRSDTVYLCWLLGSELSTHRKAMESLLLTIAVGESKWCVWVEMKGLNMIVQGLAQYGLALTHVCVDSS